MNAKKEILIHLAHDQPPSLDSDLVHQAIQYTRNEWRMIAQLKNTAQTQGPIAYTLNFPFSLGKTATYLCTLPNIVIGMAGERKRETLDLSLRTSDHRIDLNPFLRTVTRELDGTGGGHPLAAGARIPLNFFPLLCALNQYVSSLEHQCF